MQQCQTNPDGNNSLTLEAVGDREASKRETIGSTGSLRHDTAEIGMFHRAAGKGSAGTEGKSCLVVLPDLSISPFGAVTSAGQL